MINKDLSYLKKIITKTIKQTLLENVSEDTIEKAFADFDAVTGKGIYFTHQTYSDSVESIFKNGITGALPRMWNHTMSLISKDHIKELVKTAAEKGAFQHRSADAMVIVFIPEHLYKDQIGDRPLSKVENYLDDLPLTGDVFPVKPIGAFLIKGINKVEFVTN